MYNFNCYFNSVYNRLKLDGQGRARREAARRRNSECKIVDIPLAAMAVGLQRSGDWLAARRSDQCYSRSKSDFAKIDRILHVFGPQFCREEGSPNFCSQFIK